MNQDDIVQELLNRLNRARDDCQTIEDSLAELQRFHLCLGQVTDNSHFVMIDSTLQSLSVTQLRGEVASLKSRLSEMLRGYQTLIEQLPKILEDKSDFYEVVNRFRLICSVTQSLNDSLAIIDAVKSENENEAENIHSEAVKINEDLSLFEEDKDQLVRENALYDDIQELEDEQKSLKENLEIHKEELSNIVEELGVAMTELEQIGHCSDEICSSDSAHDEHITALLEEARKEHEDAITKMKDDLKEAEMKLAKCQEISSDRAKNTKELAENIEELKKLLDIGVNECEMLQNEVDSLIDQKENLVAPNFLDISSNYDLKTVLQQHNEKIISQRLQS
ncbi:hypothetical protein FO519_003454 [Halicephalobus sp. NKZ332]|nr:hypothetical protein FO519_003454 [Halicephalobus sp. NKZ332]